MLTRLYCSLTMLLSFPLNLALARNVVYAALNDIISYRIMLFIVTSDQILILFIVSMPTIYTLLTCFGINLISKYLIVISIL